MNALRHSTVVCAAISIWTVTSLSLAACSADLVISKDEDAKEVVEGGVPFRLAEPWVATGDFTKHSEGGDCDDSPFTEHLSLPSGGIYYASVDIKDFAKSEFSIALNENGTLNTLSSNSSSQFKDTAEGFKALVESVPVLGTLGLTDVLTKACDTGKEYDQVVPLQVWLDQHVAG